MSMSEAKRKANDKYLKKLDNITIRVHKGKKDEYKESAKDLGYSSFNKFVVDAIEEKILRG